MLKLFCNHYKINGVNQIQHIWYCRRAYSKEQKPRTFSLYFHCCLGPWISKQQAYVGKLLQAATRWHAARHGGYSAFERNEKFRFKSLNCAHMSRIDWDRPDFKYSAPFSEHVSDHMSKFMFKKIWYSFL